MSLLDLLLVLMVGASVIAGFAAGFARVGFGFIAAVTGVLFGFWFYAAPAAFLRKIIHSAPVSNVLGFLIVFWAILVVGAIVGKLLSTFFKWTGLSWMDRLLGGAFGFIRGAVIGTGFVAVLLAFAPKPLPTWMVNSKLLPYAVDASNLFASLAPQELKEAVRDGMEELRKDWDEEVRKSQRRKRRGEERQEDQPEDRKDGLKRLGDKEVI